MSSYLQIIENWIKTIETINYTVNLTNLNIKRTFTFLKAKEKKHFKIKLYTKAREPEVALLRSSKGIETAILASLFSMFR